MALNQSVKHSPTNLVNVNNQICLLSHNLIKYMNENATWGLVELKKKEGIDGVVKGVLFRSHSANKI